MTEEPIPIKLSITDDEAAALSLMLYEYLIEFDFKFSEKNLTKGKPRFKEHEENIRVLNLKLNEAISARAKKEFKLFKRETVDADMHQSYLDHLKTDIIGFCGCGSDEVMYLLRDLLQEMLAFDDHRTESQGKPYDSSKWYEHEQRMLTIIGDNKKSILDFIYYWLDSKGFTEHGSSIPGWIDGKGESLLHDLNLAIEEEKQDD